MLEREHMAGDSAVVAGLEQAARRFAAWAWINVGIAFLGGVLTFASYNATSSGSQYVAFKGAIVLGPIFAVINTVRFFRTRSRISAIKAATATLPPRQRNTPPQAAPRPVASNPENRQHPAQVFNPPPGWPRPPEGWKPSPGWKPEPSWPTPPKGWNLLVDPELLMTPVDLGEDLDFGPSARVTKKRLKEASIGAADAIAWQVCRAASERKENPLATLAGASEHVRTATAKAKGRIFSRLIAETNSWVQESQGSIHEWDAALQHARMMLDRRDAFEGLVDKRVKAVISAAVAPPRQESTPKLTPPASPAFSAPPHNPQGRRPTKVDKAPVRRDFFIGLGMLGLLVIAVVVSGIQNGSSPSSGTAASAASSKAGNSPQPVPAAVPSVRPSLDPAVIKQLDSTGSWYRSGDFYAMWVTNGTYTCRTGTACTELWIQTPLYNGCGTAEAAVDLLRNGTIIGSAKGTVKYIPTAVSTKVHIDAAPGLNPDKVELNHVTCLG